MKRNGILEMGFAIVLVLSLIATTLAGCAAPAPTPAAPTAAPAPAQAPAKAPAAPTATSPAAVSPAKAPAAATWNPPMPKTLTMGVHDVGGGAYQQAMGVAEGIFRQFGVRVRGVPAMSAVSRTMLVRTGKADLALMAEILEAQEGITDFAAFEWGPQPIRMVYIGDRRSLYSWVAAADAGIKTMADLKGKRIAVTVGSPYTEEVIKASLFGFGKLTLQDVKVIQVNSPPAMARAVIDGQADATLLSSEGAVAYELEKSPRGLYWIPIPPDDKEGWAYLHKFSPNTVSIAATYGPGLSEAKPVWGMTLAYPPLFTYREMDEGSAYWMTKMIAESYDKYKDISEPMKWLRLEDAMKTVAYIPYHPGSVRYFKEKGVWTEQFEKNQKELLDRQAKLEKAWNETIDEASGKGVKVGDFPAFWSKKRVEALPQYWQPTPVGSR